MFLDNLVQKIKSYFPEDALKEFWIFKPEKFPHAASDSLSYGVKEILGLCKYFIWNGMEEQDCKEKLLPDWARLVESIVDSIAICELRKKETKPFAFWSTLLEDESLGVDFTPLTREVLKTILVLPVGSADAERGFSVMNHINTSRRSRLTNEHLEALMRVRLNGPVTLDDFYPAKYAKNWVKNHMRTDDPKGKKANSKTPIDDDSVIPGRSYLARSSLF